VNLGVATVLAGAAIGLALALFGAKMLVTGRAPAVTARSFRNVRVAALYHLLFGLALVVLAVGTSLRGRVASIASAVIGVVLVGIALARYRPRGRRSADRE
jgi:hypothetical protein